MAMIHSAEHTFCYIDPSKKSAQDASAGDGSSPSSPLLDFPTTLQDNVIYIVRRSNKEFPAIDISITSQSNDKYTLLKIRDNGIGISRDDQRIIFDKFGRAAVHEQNRKGGVSGFGLGLNYVDQVMQAHGGKVTVTSEKDKYSEFTLFIPKQ